MGNQLHRIGTARRPARLTGRRPARPVRAAAALALLVLIAGCGARGATTATPAVLTVEPCEDAAGGPAVLCSAHPITTAAPEEPVRVAPRSTPPAPSSAATRPASAAPTTTSAPPAAAAAAAVPDPTEVAVPVVDEPVPPADAVVDNEPAPEPEQPAPVRPVTTLSPRTAKVGGGLAANVVVMANAERAKAGLGPLAVDTRLTAAANAHSADQAAMNHMDHTGADGSTMADRVNASGFRWRALGENVAVGYSDAASVMTGWMKSAGHRKNILTAGFTAIGVGVAAAGDGTYYWTMDLGTGG